MTCNILTCFALNYNEKIQNDVNNVVKINAQVCPDLGCGVGVVEAGFNRHIQCYVEKQQ